MKKIRLLMATMALTLFGTFAMPLMAQAAVSSISTDFESSSFLLGNINGQNSWTKTGSFDAAVSANTSGSGTFGAQSLRLSDATTSGSFGDQTFASPLANAVGEVNSTNGSYSAGTLQRRFTMQFDIASALPATQQVGMHTSVSPDRGDGSRMSYLRFEDNASGIDIFFDDVQGSVVQGVGGCLTPICANFIETKIASALTRSNPHSVKLTLDTLDGPSNDVVKVWIDGVLEITGKSWEDYYRFDSESVGEQSPRIVKTILFRESGDAHPANAGKGFLFDNLSYSSGGLSANPLTDKDGCKNDGWMSSNSPVFKNQGDCVSYFAKVKKTTMTLNSNNMNGINIPTVSGGRYKITLSGTWTNRGGEVVDAECTSWQGGPWLNEVNGGYSPDLLDVQVNNAFVNWGDCDSDTHTYSKWVVGTGSPINLRVFDGDTNTNTQIAGWFGDNIGTFNVNIMAHPNN